MGNSSSEQRKILNRWLAKFVTAINAILVVLFVIIAAYFFIVGNIVTGAGAACMLAGVIASLFVTKKGYAKTAGYLAVLVIFLSVLAVQTFRYFFMGDELIVLSAVIVILAAVVLAAMTTSLRFSIGIAVVSLVYTFILGLKSGNSELIAKLPVVVIPYVTTIILVSFYIISQRRMIERLLYKNNLIRRNREELRLEKMKSEQADKAKSDFLAKMSHELRTPLHGVLSFANLAKEKNSDEKIDSYLKRIENTGQDLLQQINALLDLSKIEAGAEEFNIESGDIEACIKEVGDELAAMMMKKDININYELTTKDKQLHIRFDNKKIKQVLRNIISNSIKFSPANSTIIVCSDIISVRNLQRRKDILRVSISDEGPGLARGEEEAIFGNFTQGSGAVKVSAKGTGLGLAISKGIVLAHKGDIWASNNHRGGTDISFVIPVLPPDSKAFRQEAENG